MWDISKVKVRPLEVATRVRQLGLKVSELRDAIRAGELERHSCTALDPKSAPGWEAWRWTVRRLREILIPRGFTWLDRDNLPLVVNPKTGVAIAVATGDTATGKADPKLWPTTKYPRGPTAHRYIAVNRLLRLPFDWDNEVAPMPAPIDDELVTWLLLIHSTEKAVRAELSLPSKVDENGYIVEWEERLILNPVSLDEESDPMTDSRHDDEGDEALDVPVAPRGK